MDRLLPFRPFLIPGLRLPRPSTEAKPPVTTPWLDDFLVAQKLLELRPSSPLLHRYFQTSASEMFCSKKNRESALSGPPRVISIETARRPALRGAPDPIEVERLLKSLNRSLPASLISRLGRRAVEGDPNAVIVLAVSAFGETLGGVALILLKKMLEKQPSLFAFLKAQATAFPKLVSFLDRLYRTAWTDIPLPVRRQAFETLQQLDLAPFLDQTLKGHGEAAEALNCLYGVVEEDDEKDRILEALTKAGRTHLPAAKQAIDLILHEMGDYTPIYQCLLPMLKNNDPAVDYLKRIFLTTRNRYILFILVSATEQDLYAARCLCDVLEFSGGDDHLGLLPGINLEFLRQLSRSEGKDAGAACEILRRMGRLGHPQARPAGEPTAASGNGRGAKIIPLLSRKK